MTNLPSTSENSSIKDSFYSWAFWTLLGCVFFCIAVVPFLGLWGGLILIFIWPLTGVFAMSGFAHSLKCSFFRRATSMATLFAFISWPFVAHDSFAMSIGRLSNIVHLFSERSRFELKYHGNPPADKPIWALDWSTFVTSNTFVIYDGSGRIALPKQHGAWNAADMKLFTECADRVTPIYGNYYRCDQ